MALTYHTFRAAENNTNESPGIIFDTKSNKLMWSGMGDIVAAKSHGIITPQTETKKIASFTQGRNFDIQTLQYT
jgi:hypothetical protein